MSPAALATSENVSSPLFDYETWEDKASAWHSEYVNSPPFPNIAIDDFISKELARRLSTDFDQVDWQAYKHYNEDKQGGNAATFPPLLSQVLAEFNSPRFLRLIEKISGISKLIPDPSFGSGGIHQSKRGGFLNIHADFTVHPYHPNWHRRINLLVYLTEWQPEWGAQLELWSTDMSKCERKIVPTAGRAAMFSTTKDSYHGHPDPMTCPDGIWRRSIALYYYTEGAVDAVATNYQPRPDDGRVKRILISLDKFAVSVFHATKRLFGVKDSAATSIMDKLKGK